MGEVELPSQLERIVRFALCALAALFATMSPAAAASSSGRIIAVGDLHGDYRAWLDIARAARLIDANGDWSGGDTTLVQLGDVLDREPDSLKIVRSLQKLETEAPRANGRVIVLLGNHEAMNLLGDFRYTTAGEFAAFADERSAARRERLYMSIRSQIETAARASNPAALPSEIREGWMAQHPPGWLEHKQAWSPSGELGQWATHNPAIVKIGGTLFVHGGISAEYSKFSLDEINRRVNMAMASGDEGPSTILYDPLGPLWYRGLVMRDDDAQLSRSRARPQKPQLTPDEEVDTVLAAYGAQRMVIGHTPDLAGIEFVSKGRVARIDTGISRAYGGPLTWLEIINGRMIPHSVERSTQ